MRPETATPVTSLSVSELPVVTANWSFEGVEPVSRASL